MVDVALIIGSIVFGFTIGGIYALVALGLSMTFGLMRIINLAHGLIYAFGAYILYTTLTVVGNFWLSLLVATTSAALLGLPVERFLLRRLYGRDVILTLIIAFAVMLLGIGFIEIVWGLIGKPVADPIGVSIMVSGIEMPIYRLLIIVLSFAIYGLIALFLNRTIIGMAIRASVEDLEKVQALGINPYRIFTVAYVVSSACAGLAGGLHAPLIMVYPYMGLDIILLAFVTVIMGGLGSIKGTLIAGIIVGQVSALGTTIWGPAATVVVFITMAIVLLIKPTGFFGRE